jgi:hypothetical protein
MGPEIDELARLVEDLQERAGFAPSYRRVHVGRRRRIRGWDDRGTALRLPIR